MSEPDSSSHMILNYEENYKQDETPRPIKKLKTEKETEINNENSGNDRIFNVGSRKSELALIQTNWVISELKQIYPTYKFNIITMTTVGDRILNQALSKIGEKNLFTKELEIALERREVDFVVHSLKDLPTTLPTGMLIGAVCEREDPSDAVVLKAGIEGSCLDDLEAGSIIGTSSVRRIAQLTKCYPKLKFRSIRGNLNTRLRKLDEGNDYSAIVLAAAGLKRMGWEDRISHYLVSNQCLYAVGQGALAVECRVQDANTLKLLSKLSNEKSSLQCVAERAFMKRLGGGCSAPVAVCSSLQEDYTLQMTGGVFSLDGAKSIVQSKSINLRYSVPSKEPNGNIVINSTTVFSGIASNENVSAEKLLKAEEFGNDLAEQFIKMGGKVILDEARSLNDNN